MTTTFQLDAPDLFTVGAVGPPGERTFYLQGRQQGTVVTLKCEKQQVNALAEYLAGLLVRVDIAARPVPGNLDLVEPLQPVWTVASLGVGWDETTRRIVIVASPVAPAEAEAGGEDEDEEEVAAGETADPDDDPDTEGATDVPVARFSITTGQAQAFIERARAVVRAGRPTCPMCGQTQEPGHVCARSNGQPAH
jgi:uncharacterized repeat protein (TIGR03847 family)